MCLLILNKNKEIPREHLLNGFNSNSDGAGIGYIEDGMLKISKFSRFKKFYKKYVEIRKNNPYPIIIHFRLTSAGGDNEMNMHPFFINKDMIFAHNGHMSALEDINNIYSDTYILRLLLKKSKYDVYNEEEINRMLGYVKNICSVSRFVFLRRDGKYFILNESVGNWEYNKDTWYSNSSYKSRSYVYSPKCNIGIKDTNKNSYSNKYSYNYDYYNNYNDMYYNNAMDTDDYEMYYNDAMNIKDTEDVVSDNKNTFLYEYDKVFLRTASLEDIIKFYRVDEMAKYYEVSKHEILSKDTINKIIKDLISDRVLSYFEEREIETLNKELFIDKINSIIEYGDITFEDLFEYIILLFDDIENGY